MALNTQSIVFKLGAMTAAIVLIVLSGLTYYSTESMKKNSDRVTVQSLTTEVDQVVHTLAVYDEALGIAATLASRVFATQFPAEFSLETATVDGAQKSVLRHGDKIVNEEASEVDQFTARSGAVATLFARQGNDFIRVTTSLRKADGTRAVGTMLGPDHPAHDALLAKKTYTGKATLFGRDYVTQYVPLIDKSGTVVGARFVGVDFTEGLKSLLEKTKKLKVGETGYFYAMDAKPGASYGALTMHPTTEGKSMLDAKDENGREFVKEMLQTKRGVMRYEWLNRALGETQAREKLAVYAYFEPWNWVVAGGSYIEEFERAQQRLRKMLIAAGVGAVILTCALLYFAVRKLVIQPLKRAVAVASHVASGDLRIVPQAERADEIGALMTALGGMTHNLGKIVHEIRSASGNVSTAAQQIAAGNADLSQRTEEQASSLEETAASMEELAGTVRVNAGRATEAHQVAGSVSTAAVRGSEVVDRVVATMNGINDSSRQIADILGVIDSIAFQTNILALNAAVEAARAGEQGRGFAVVASEVRALATRSAAAAKEIKALIGDSVVRVGEGAKLVDEAGETMRELVSSVERVETIMGEITAAAYEQSSGIDQVNDAVVQMDQVTQQNAALVEEASAAAESLCRQAVSLTGLAEMFQLADERRDAPESTKAAVQTHGARPPQREFSRTTESRAAAVCKIENVGSRRS